ncbi:MAG: hypothetical protein WAW73_02500 [Rhodoferax sp.]
MFRTVLLLIATVTCLGLTACGQVPLSYQPTMANLETLKAAKNAPMNVGQFALAPGKAATMDQSVTARATTVTSPNNSSFALFLKDALTQELRAVGKFDPNSSIVVSGLLTKSELEAPVGTGKAALAASFTVTRDGNRVYSKELEEKAEWPSAFIGADAIPTAINQYTSLYKKLLGKLFGDNDFTLATQPK